jgi:glycosyltransferase involved in cell wall biosynthesis
MDYPPKILPPTEVGKSRPFWSVMIPAYNPSPDYLSQTLRSVLAQDAGLEQMQIEVVDDCSPGMDVAALVKSIAGERVKVSQTPKNLGLAGCWNTCIERSRGQWVHILHQDDWVLPEFYKRFESLIKAAPKIEAAFARYILADADGHWKTLGVLEFKLAGEFNGFDKLIATRQRIQCAAAVVKRSAYERLGGYRGDLPYVLDREMWCRLAASSRWGYVPQPGAVYRQHPQSETERLRLAGETFRDMLEGGRIARMNFSRELQIQTEPEFQNNFVKFVFDDALRAYVAGSLKEARRLLEQFQGEAMKSKYRWDWRWLRFRVRIKPARQLLSRVRKGKNGNRRPAS